MPVDTEDYHQIFIKDTALLDVRAPIEFGQGAFPMATNLPLLDDQQRKQIGIRYKQHGQDEAIRLGLELATPAIRAERLQGWLAYCAANPGGYLYCFRGGLRSRTTQQWLREAGIDYPLVRGGYKAMRRFLLDDLEQSAKAVPLVCIGGLTGSGKTQVLLNLEHHLDLEGLARHRGSAFGRNALDCQPGVIDFENRVSIEMLRHRSRFPGRPLFVEDEGRRIGRLGVPENLFQSMLAAPRAILRLDLEKRVRLIAADYIQLNWPGYQSLHGEAAESEFTGFVLGNLEKIHKRLGTQRYTRVRQAFESGLASLFIGGAADGFYDGIKILLEDYYDPMYRYQLESKQPQILFEGEADEFYQWAGKYHGN